MYPRNGNTVLLSSHILEIVENLCDEVILIKKGKVLYFGSLDELKKKFKTACTLEEIYMEVFENERISSFSKN